MTGFVLYLGDEDRLAPQARGAGDPVALGLLPDHLRVRVLRDLADHRLAIFVGHPVAGFDLGPGLDGGVELLLRCRHEDMIHGVALWASSMYHVVAR